MNFDEWEKARDFYDLDGSMQYTAAQRKKYVRRYKEMTHSSLHPRERDIIIAALRLWQSARRVELLPFMGIATNEGKHTVLGDAGINELIEGKLS